MANFFGNNKNPQNISERDLLLGKYHTGRHNLLLVVLFSVINVILLVTNSDRYFLFSAFIPYFVAFMGMDLCGMFPVEFYEYDGYLYSDYEFMDKSVFVIALIFALTIVALYLISWFMAKKPRVGFMIFALVLFVIDTIGMFLISGFAVESVLDIVFHAWVIISLANGIISYYKLKKLPPEEPAPEAEAVQEAEPVSTLNGETIE